MITETLGLFQTPLHLCNPLAKKNKKNPFSRSKTGFNRAVNSQIKVRSENKVFQNKIDNAFKFTFPISVKHISSPCWFHIETSQVICIANQLTGCNMKATWDLLLNCFSL